MTIKNFIAARGERGTGRDIGQEGRETDRAASRPAPSAPAPRTVAPPTSIDGASEFKGTLRSKDTVRIDGSVTGEIVCEKLVLIGEGANVHANIVADTVQVSGEVRGDITARSKLMLDRTARVTGDLATPGIVIEEGAKLEGRIMIGSEEKAEAKQPSTQDAPQVSKPAPRAEGKSTRKAPPATAAAAPA